MRRGGMSILAVATLMASGAAVQGAQMRSLDDLVSALERNQPLSVKTVEALTGVGLACNDGRCEGGGFRLADVSVGRVDFRFGSYGSLLILADLANGCIAPRKLAETYPGGITRNSCTDGAICNYYGLARPWGTLSFGVPGRQGEPDCATSVIFNQKP